MGVKIMEFQNIYDPGPALAVFTCWFADHAFSFDEEPFPTPETLRTFAHTRYGIHLADDWCDFLANLILERYETDLGIRDFYPDIRDFASQRLQVVQ